MIGSLFAGVSGLNANATAMSVIGDNIANINTTAFKSSRASFANILSQSLEGTSGNDIGRGVYFWGLSPSWSQGALENTNNPTDLAINGRGFFMLKDASGSAYYSRAGEFRFDKDGKLLNPDGMVVQGYDVDSNGVLGAIGDISIPLGSNPPSATDEMITTINLDAGATAEGAAAGVLDGLLTITAESGLFGNITINLVDGAAVAEVTDIACGAESALSGGEYFTISSPGTDYYVWYDIDNGSVDPAPPGLTGIEVDIASGDTADQVATKTAAAIGAVADFSASATAGTVTITNSTGGAATDGADNNTGFTLTTTTDGLIAVTAGNETVMLDGSTMTVRIDDGVSTQQNISDAIAGHASISTVVPATGGAVWTLGAGTDAVALTGGADGGSYSSTITVYDSLGNDIALTLNFVRTATGWDWTASSSSGACNSSGSVQFDADGNLSSPTMNPVIDITGLSGGAAPIAIEWSLIGSNGSLTGYASTSTTTFMSQSGCAAGTLQSVSIDEKGMVIGVFSNGQMDFFQLALVDFPSYWGLSKSGNNLYLKSMSSGDAMPGIAGSGRLGTLTPKSLEMSNVDLASEFVKMITSQRAFQANSKVITTSDEILADLINIKR